MLCVITRRKNHLARLVGRRGASGGRDQTRFAAQKTFLVRVQNRHKQNFRQIQPSPQQIDSDQHVQFAFAVSARENSTRQSPSISLVQINAPLCRCHGVIGQFFPCAWQRRTSVRFFFVARCGLLHQIINLTLSGLIVTFDQ